jgi:hypothetical protein
MKEFFPRFARGLNGVSPFSGIMRQSSSVILDVAKFRPSVLISRANEASVFHSERMSSFILQSKLGLHCDLMKERLGNLKPDDFRQLNTGVLLQMLTVTIELLKWGHDASSIQELILNEMESPRRLSELVLEGSQTDILRIIRCCMALNRPAPELATLCCDKLCAWLDRRSIEDLIGILDWMIKFNYKHSQLLHNLTKVILVVPTSDEEFQKIVERLIQVRGGQNGPDEEFLIRLVKFRLATVDL